MIDDNNLYPSFLPILRLPDIVVDKIAAGEVIENPASVVKELIENSLDAKADLIVISVDKGGLSSITVSDNGYGIPQENLDLAFERHATSKIRSFEDLATLQTMGFRGEALASIVAISHVIVESRTRENSTGTMLSIKGGQKTPMVFVACPIGTRVRVEHLFFNTPVRKKFLKSQSAELRRITAIVTKYILARSDVGYMYIVDGHEKFRFSLSETLSERIGVLFGKEIVAQLIPVAVQKTFVFEDEGQVIIDIQGFIGKPQIARNNRTMQYIFINQRPIDDFVLSHRIKQAYGMLLDKKLHPSFFLVITVPQHVVDVNVHPRKSEVRFPTNFPLYNLIEEMVRNALQTNSLEPCASFSLVHAQSSDVSRKYPSTQANRLSLPFLTGRTSSYADHDLSSFAEGSRTSILSQEGFSPRDRCVPVPLQQLFSTYIFAKEADGEEFLLIDQHAAQERILYERCLHEVLDGEQKLQELLIPEIVEVSENEYSLVQEYSCIFERLGFGVDDFGDRQILIRHTPACMKEQDIRAAFVSILDDITDEKPQIIRQGLLEKIIMKACKASIKAHQKLHQESMVQLLVDLYSCRQPFTCPHGRPTIIRLTETTLERLFRRT